jgi:hypothetical protein
MNGAALEFARTAERRELTRIDERDAIAVLGFVHVVGGDDDANPVAGERIDEVPEAPPRGGVHPGGRLVEEQDRRLVQHRATKRQALLPAARKVSDHRVRPVCEPRHADRELEPLLEPRALHPIDAAEEVQVLHDREIAIERELLRHVADMLAHTLGKSRDVVACDGRLAVARPQKAAQDSDGRRLARAVGAEEADDLSRLRFEADRVHRNEIAEPLGQAISDDSDLADRRRARHPSPSVVRSETNRSSIEGAIRSMPSTATLA